MSLGQPTPFPKSIGWGEILVRCLHSLETRKRKYKNNQMFGLSHKWWEEEGSIGKWEREKERGLWRNRGEEIRGRGRSVWV